MTLVLSQAEVRRLLPMERCIERMEQAMRSLSEGGVTNPLRWPMRLESGAGLLGMMPGATSTPATLGLKVVAIFPGNHGTQLDSHQGLVVLFDPACGTPLGIFDASEITALRTAAVSAVATRALARADASELAILGTGVQARSHLEAVCCVRQIRRARVYSRSAERRERFAARESERLGIAVEATASAREAVEGAHVICTTTSSAQPVLLGEWLEPGMHINAAGACTPRARELDGAALARAMLYTDSLESLKKEAGDWLLAIAEGAIDADRFAGPLGEVLTGRIAGRALPDDITLYESLGLAVQDLISAHELLERARAEGVGTEVDLGGRVDA